VDMNRPALSIARAPAMEAGLTHHVWTSEEMLDKVGL
jgi:hypothetical protein